MHAPESLRVSQPTYPTARPFRVDGLDEDFHVLDGNARVRIELDSLVRDGEAVPVDIEVHYQACADTECFIPSTIQLHLDLPVGKLTPQAATPS